MSVRTLSRPSLSNLDLPLVRSRSPSPVTTSAGGVPMIGTCQAFSHDRSGADRHHSCHGVGSALPPSMTRATLITLCFSGLIACERPQESGPGTGPPIRAVASVPAAAQWLRELGGDLIEVDLLLPPGASPHLWQPTIATMRTLARADLRVFVGGGMEPWAGQILQAAGPSRHDFAMLA